MKTIIKALVYGIVVGLVVHYFGLSKGASIAVGWLVADIEIIYWKVVELNSKI